MQAVKFTKKVDKGKQSLNEESGRLKCKEIFDKFKERLEVCLLTASASLCNDDEESKTTLEKSAESLVQTNDMKNAKLP